jgi:hypothetical protein
MNTKASRGIKGARWFIAISAIALMLILSCDIGKPVAEYGAIAVDLAAESRTIQPDAAAYTVVSYDIAGAGPGGALFTASPVTTSNYTRSGLVVGLWTVTVSGRNSGGHVISQEGPRQLRPSSSRGRMGTERWISPSIGHWLPTTTALPTASRLWGRPCQPRVHFP